MDLKTFGTYTRADQLYMVSSSLNFESWFGFHLFNHVNVPWSDWCCCWFCRNKNSVLFFVITGFVWQKCVTTQLLYSGFRNFKNAVKVFFPLSFIVQREERCCYQTQVGYTLASPRPHSPPHFVTSDSDIVLLWLGFTKTSSWGVNKNNNLSQCHH